MDQVSDRRARTGDDGLDQADQETRCHQGAQEKEGILLPLFGEIKKSSQGAGPDQDDAGVGGLGDGGEEGGHGTGQIASHPGLNLGVDGRDALGRKLNQEGQEDKKEEGDGPSDIIGIFIFHSLLKLVGA